MSFEQFKHLSLRDFIVANGDEDALWLFIHIPKTAGSSLANELARMRRPYRNVHIDYTLQDAPFDDQMQRAVDRFIADARGTRFRSASGHITIDHARQIRDAIPGTKFVTFLREPAARVLSDFRYARTPNHPPYREFISAFPDIDSYVSSDSSQNKMARHMGSDDPDKIFAEFDFVGALELYPMSFNIFFALMGEDALPQLHERKTRQTEDNDVDLTSTLENSIRAANTVDVRIFNAVRDALRSKRPQWRERRQREQERSTAVHAIT